MANVLIEGTIIETFVISNWLLGGYDISPMIIMTSTMNWQSVDDSNKSFMEAYRNRRLFLSTRMKQIICEPAPGKYEGLSGVTHICCQQFAVLKKKKNCVVVSLIIKIHRK